MRIVSLLPSATEIAFALGLGNQVVGVTHECDWPPEAGERRKVSHSNIPPGASASEIDSLVSASAAGGAPTYRLDIDAIRELAPDVVLTQDLCAVCAVPSGQVEAALDTLGCRAEVVSLDPSSLEDVFDNIISVATVTGTEARARRIVADLQERLSAVGARVAGRPRPRTFALEWGDPPYNGGHWIPQMIELAGGRPVLGNPGAPSVRVTWEAIGEVDPEVVVFMPCGFDLDVAVAEARVLLDRAELARAAVYAAHANAHFSRPGPRLVDGVEILAGVLQPEGAGATQPGAIVRLR